MLVQAWTRTLHAAGIATVGALLLHLLKFTGNRFSIHELFEVEPLIPPSPATDRGVDVERIIFNRVPKCGSSAVENIIRAMSAMHNFTYYRSLEFSHFSLDESGQRDLVTKLMTLNTPMIYDRHLFFLDFNRFFQETPVYINLIRDPVNQKISSYYYLREVDPRMPDDRKRMSFDECVTIRHWECVGAQTTLIAFFCGQDPICKIRGEQSLQRALTNLEKYFSVVGVMEDLDGFFYLLEQTHPHFFAKAHHVFQPIKEDLQKRYKTANRSEVSLKSREYMRLEMEYEYEFYNRVKSRFYQQLAKVNLFKNVQTQPDIIVN